MCLQLRARIPLYRLEVKERCATLLQIVFLSVGSVPTIAQIVARQLSRYNYTFPTTSNVSSPFFFDPWLISVQGNHLHVVSNRSKPYRNSRIITVIRDLCFIGGTNSFAHRFHSRFPTFQGDDGRVVHEVPIAMVALVATAVSAIYFYMATLY